MSDLENPTNPAERTITIARHANQYIKFTFTQSDGTALNLSTIDSMRLSVRQNYLAATVLFDVDIANSVDGNNWAAGIVRANIPKAKTALLSEDGVFDLLFIEDSIPTVACRGVAICKLNAFTPLA